MNGSGIVLDRLVAADPLRVVRRPAQSTDVLGYGPCSAYVETFWLPTLGPLATFTFRRLGVWLEQHPDGVWVSLEELGECLGVGGGTGRRAPIVRALGRLADFRAATLDADRYTLRSELPMLSTRQVERLPACLITAHEQLIQGSTRGIQQASTARQSDVR